MIQKPRFQSAQRNSSVRRVESGDEPVHELRGRLIDSLDEMESMYAEWETLLDSSVHRNLFYDPDFLIPSFRYLGDDSVSLLVIDAARKSNPQGPRVLCGLVPVQRKRIYGLPLKGYEFWRHPQCLDGTPLLRSDCATQVLAFMLEFLGQQNGAKLLSLDTVSNEGEFAHILTDVLHARKSACFYRDAFTRACFMPEMDAETYVEMHVSKSVTRNLRRMQRRLQELGDVKLVCHPDQAAENENLIDQFVELEASGWKGQAGTALRCDERNYNFFREMVTRSLVKDKLSFLALTLDGRPISMLCDLYAGDIGYAFKTAYDDSMSEYSPGLMLEVQNIEHMHDRGVTFADSCTLSDNSTMNRVWGGRIGFQSLVIPLRDGLSNWATALMPLMQQLRRAWKRS